MDSSLSNRPPSPTEESRAKRAKLDHKPEATAIDARDIHPDRRNGIAFVKAEYLVSGPAQNEGQHVVDDDAAEASGYHAQNDTPQSGRQKNKKNKGMNTNRRFGRAVDAIQLCISRINSPELSPGECPFGDKCKFEHDLRKYLKEGKRGDLETFDGKCPVFSVLGFCPSGWKCRFVGSHSKERDTEDGRKELILLEDTDLKSRAIGNTAPDDIEEPGHVNVLRKEKRLDLAKRRLKLPNSDAYIEWLNKSEKAKNDNPKKKGDQLNGGTAATDEHGKTDNDHKESKEENRAQYIEPPFRPSEKRRIYYGPETPILAPLTTQGNLPFRRLCVSLGAQVTWSEMAMGLPLVQGERSEWALVRAHEDELSAPKFERKNTVVQGYDSSKDFKFGVQIAANKPWLALKTTEVLTYHCPRLRAIDLNCGCPIDLVYKQGSGSALLENPGKLEKILRGMNAVSNEVPITAKIRMGTKDNHPTAEKLVQRLVLGGPALEEGEDPSGVAAIALHGRSRQQRYTKRADWSYIASCAALIKRCNQERDDRSDTIAEADARDQASSGHVYFVGNGDCYSHVDYDEQLQNAKVDSVMIGRGALIKPWIFEEIEQGQALDKSSSQRLEYIEKFVKYGLQTWGSDEMGVGTTRKFLLEWLSFACRYIPVGLLEQPQRLNDRPPVYRGRDDMETLMASDNYKDWIKISEMFLGPVQPGFRFEPKHKSNSYEINAEG